MTSSLGHRGATGPDAAPNQGPLRGPLVEVIGVGAKSGLGDNALQVAMIARARKAEPRPSPFVSSKGRAFHLVWAEEIPAHLQGIDRLLALARGALAEACAGHSGEALPVLLGLPEATRPDGGGLNRDFVRWLARESSVALDFEKSEVFRAGHAAFALALSAAVQMLRGPAAPPAVVVGAVDSFAHATLLERLDRGRRIHRPGARSGFVPGEGAAFLLLTRGRPGDPKAPVPLARILSVETGKAPVQAVRAKTDRAHRKAARAPERFVNVGKTSIDLVTRALAAQPNRPAGWVLCDVNGEVARAIEWSSVAAKALAHARVDRLAEALGDVGAASGALYAAIACAFFHVGCAPATSALVAIHSDDADRGVFVIEQGTPPGYKVDSVAKHGPTGSPASRMASLARDALERIQIPRFGAVLADALDRTWAELGALERSSPRDPDHLDRLDSAAASVAAVRTIVVDAYDQAAHAIAESLAGIERRLRDCRSDTIDAIVRATQPRAGSPIEAASHEDAFVASVGIPRLHVLPRSGFGPFAGALMRQTDDERPQGEISTDLAESDDGPPTPSRGNAPRPAPPHVRRLARDCIEEIGRLGTLRRSDVSPWTREIEHIEQRLLNHLDALIALGCGPGMCSKKGLPQRGPGTIDVLAELIDYTGTSGGDSSRRFARAFVLGCIEGEDTVRVAVMALRRSKASSYEPETDAFALAPSSAIGPAMERLSIDSNPAVVRVALDVLEARREAKYPVLVTLLSHPHAAVRRSAARAMGVALQRSAATSALRVTLDDELDDDFDGPVSPAIAMSLLRQDDPSGLEALRDRLSREVDLGDRSAIVTRHLLLRLLALAGGAPDLDLLRTRLVDPEEVAALGFFGHAAAVEPLIGVLEREQAKNGSSALRTAAAEAIHRITGERPEGASQTGYMTTDPALWRGFWEKNARRFEPAVRHRFGRPYTPESSLEELERSDVPTEVREACAFEVAVLTGGASRLWVQDWTRRQLAFLAVLRQHFAGPGRRLHGQGQWLAQQLGKRATAPAG